MIFADVEASGKLTAAQMTEKLTRVNEAATALGEVNKLLSDSVAKFKNELIPTAFENEKITSFTTQSGYRVTVSQLMRTSINSEAEKIDVWTVTDSTGKEWYAESQGRADAMADGCVSASIKKSTHTGKDAAYWWLRLNNLGDLIQETVNASTLAAAARKRNDDGFDMPEAYFKMAIMPSTSITKVKK